MLDILSSQENNSKTRFEILIEILSEQGKSERKQMKNNESFETSLMSKNILI